MPVFPFARSIAFIAALALPLGGLPLPSAAQTTSSGVFSGAGAYLSARHASNVNDFEQASRTYAEALSNDPGNLSLMEGQIISQIAQGNTANALAVAKLLVAQSPDNQIANMVVLAAASKGDEFEAVLKSIDAEHGVGPLVDGLLGAWAAAGMGQMSDALDRFDEVAKSKGLESFGFYHKALALISVGDFEGADAIFSGKVGGKLPPTRRGVIAHAEVLSQLERGAEAVAIIDDVFGTQLDPGISAIRANLIAGTPLERSSVRSVQDGMAEVFFSVASALDGESDDSYALLYARIAEYLRPDHSDAHLLAAVLLERLGQYDLATQAYRAVPREDPAYYAAEQGRADALRRAGREDAAIEVMEQLTRSHGDLPAVHITLGDMMRAQEKYAEAIKSYSNALALYKGEDPGQWIVYFARGIAYEREDDWDNAEADFRKALALQPDQPQVLNYLGYSYLEMKTNYDEALDMIERAVVARPNDAFITDSLGWGYYRVGRYDEAVIQMERAVELMAVDPIVNDHLGDVYWAVGRKREAEFQWSRAMSFDPEEKDAERIRRKLDIGLDAVLAEEGANPLKVANED
ncbi:MAG: tetratricopeptide repeat protein [Paracoccaceae bacterium]